MFKKYSYVLNGIILIASIIIINCSKSIEGYLNEVAVEGNIPIVIVKTSFLIVIGLLSYVLTEN